MWADGSGRARQPGRCVCRRVDSALMNGNQGEPITPDGEAQAPPEPIAVEPRWPVALTISCFVAITVGLRLTVSNLATLGPPWVIPVVEVAMLLLLLAADPARI